MGEMPGHSTQYSCRSEAGPRSDFRSLLRPCLQNPMSFFSFFFFFSFFRLPLLRYCSSSPPLLHPPPLSSSRCDHSSSSLFFSFSFFFLLFLLHLLLLLLPPFSSPTSPFASSSSSSPLFLVFFVFFFFLCTRFFLLFDIFEWHRGRGSKQAVPCLLTPFRANGTGCIDSTCKAPRLRITSPRPQTLSAPQHQMPPWQSSIDYVTSTE